MNSTEALLLTAALQQTDQLHGVASVIALLKILPPLRESHLVDLALVLCMGYTQQHKTDLLALYYSRSLEGSRRGPYGLPQSEDFLPLLLNEHGDRPFRNVFRCSKPSFLRLVETLRDHPRLTRKPGPGRPPRPAEEQIATFLICFGQLSTKLRSALEACISEGCVYNYCRNVTVALCDLIQSVIRMPTEAERIVTEEETGLAGCIGVVDGSLIPLRNKPLEHPIFYYSGRKKIYCLNLQVVGDFKLRILSFEGGFPGSVHDSKVFANSEIYRNRIRYFSSGTDGSEYLLADKGYPVTSITTRSFTIAEMRSLSPADKRLAKKFNARISENRSSIERIFAHLKGRFPAASSLPGRDIGEQWQEIAALLVLHNLMLRFKDVPGMMDDWDDAEDGDDGEAVVGGEEQEAREAAAALRGEDIGTEREQGVKLRWAIARSLFE